jgi:hypothetical protein
MNWDDLCHLRCDDAKPTNLKNNWNHAGTESAIEYEQGEVKTFNNLTSFPIADQFRRLPRAFDKQSATSQAPPVRRPTGGAFHLYDSTLSAEW